ncbi:hypothetical protein GCM10027414_36680 [Humibacter ginsengiterrae]
MSIGNDEQATHEEWMHTVLREAESNGGVIRLTGHGSVTDPHTIEAGACTQCEHTAPRGAIDRNDLDGYVVPVDPMDALGCDSCQ